MSALPKKFNKEFFRSMINLYLTKELGMGDREKIASSANGVKKNG